jgi:putative oxidoreductase
MADELLTGLALILGLGTRYAAIIMIPVLAGAIVSVHIHKGFFFDSAGGGWEFPAFWILALLVQAGLGSGAYALGRATVRRTSPQAGE